MRLICLSRRGDQIHVTHSTLWGKKIAPFYSCNNFVKPHCILIFFVTQILKEISDKTNSPPLVTDVLNPRCETKH